MAEEPITGYFLKLTVIVPLLVNLLAQLLLEFVVVGELGGRIL
jgi:hypothetical protein